MAHRAIEEVAAEWIKRDDHAHGHHSEGVHTAPAHKARSGPLPPGRGGASPPGRPAGRRRSTYACSGPAQGATVVPLEAESHREEPSNWTSVMRDREALQALMQSL